MILSGYVCDMPRAPRIIGAIAVYAVLAALAVPMFLWFPRGWAVCWALHIIVLALLGWVFGACARARARRGFAHDRGCTVLTCQQAGCALQQLYTLRPHDSSWFEGPNLAHARHNMRKTRAPPCHLRRHGPPEHGVDVPCAAPHHRVQLCAQLQHVTARRPGANRGHGECVGTWCFVGARSLLLFARAPRVGSARRPNAQLCLERCCPSGAAIVRAVGAGSCAWECSLSPHPPHTPAPAPPTCQAISVTTGNTQTAAGWYMFAITLVSMAAGAIILWVAPEANRDPVDSGHGGASAPGSKEGVLAGKGSGAVVDGSSLSEGTADLRIDL